MTAGLQPGDLIILAARPSMGKTALALNLAQNACVVPQRFANAPELGPPRYPVLFFSLEMGATQLVERVLCSEARIERSASRRSPSRSRSTRSFSFPCMRAVTWSTQPQANRSATKRSRCRLRNPSALR